MVLLLLDKGQISKLVTLIGRLCFLSCVLILLVGCSKKIVMQKSVFDLDNLSFEQPESSGENLKGKGIRLAREKSFPEAIECLKKYTETEPKDFSAFNAMAISYKNIGDFAQAMKYFEKALNLTNVPETGQDTCQHRESLLLNSQVSSCAGFLQGSRIRI